MYLKCENKWNKELLRQIPKVFESTQKALCIYFCRGSHLRQRKENSCVWRNETVEQDPGIAQLFLYLILSVNLWGKKKKKRVHFTQKWQPVLRERLCNCPKATQVTGPGLHSGESNSKIHTPCPPCSFPCCLPSVLHFSLNLLCYSYAH